MEGGGGLKDECIVLYYVCMYYWVCYAYSTTDSESVSLQNPLHKIYSKSITKNIWGFSFFFFPEYGDQCCCLGFHYN